MRTLFLGSGFLSLLLIYSCISQKEGDLGPDCAESDLAISGISVTNAGCSEPGSLMVTAEDGEGQLSYSLGGNVFQPSSVFEGLSPGNYKVVVKDENGCSVDTSATVGVDAGNVALSLDSKTNSGCGTSNGELSVSASGGTGDSYDYRIDGGSFGQASEFSGLDQGQHIVEARDDKGCTTSLAVDILSGVSLSDQVMPIIESNCAKSGCHADTEFPRFNSESAVRLEYERIKDMVSSKSMPPQSEGEDPLSDEQIGLIVCWADDEAVSN